MKIAWIHRGGPMAASYRYRAMIPAVELKKRGHETQINGGEADVVVFAKPSEIDVQGAENCKREGLKVVVDLCDDHFAHKTLGKVYREIVQHADLVTCPTKYMAGVIKSITGKDAEVIADPYEFPYTEPHAVGEKFLWFGHQINLPDIQKWFKHLQGLDLTLVTGSTDKVHHTLYTPEVLQQKLAESNVVLLPVSNGLYKSANRMVNAIRMGCFVVAESHPAHEEFKQMMWVGHLYTGLNWIKAQREDLNALVSQAQEHVEKHYSPKAIADRWEEVLR